MLMKRALIHTIYKVKISTRIQRKSNAQKTKPKHEGYIFLEMYISCLMLNVYELDLNVQPEINQMAILPPQSPYLKLTHLPNVVVK